MIDPYVWHDPWALLAQWQRRSIQPVPPVQQKTGRPLDMVAKSLLLSLAAKHGRSRTREAMEMNGYSRLTDCPYLRQVGFVRDVQAELEK